MEVMDLIHNRTFRILSMKDPIQGYQSGIYRTILNEPGLEKIATVLIEPEGKRAKPKGGRPKQSESSDDPQNSGTSEQPEKKATAKPKKKKKPPKPHIGTLIWMDHDILQQLIDDRLLADFTLERKVAVVVEGKNKEDYERRVASMAGFLNPLNLRDEILVHDGLGHLVKTTMESHGVSKSFVYKQWSNLCRNGIDNKGLNTLRVNCGAPGVARPIDPPTKTDPGRQKAGRKPLEVEIDKIYGVDTPDLQPGMSTAWRIAITAADAQIPEPKPSWPERCKQILRSRFCGKAELVDGKIEMAMPDFGAYPNERQIKRVLTEQKSRIQLLIERTTARHFKMAKRGLIGRSWRDVAGPGMTWAIDSTVGDIYLRSSLNPAWIVGRPIVYVIVDVWSTAVVGFHVCLTGPSWSTAKVSIFNAIADPALMGSLWGYQPVLSLNPLPTICFQLECDRGEYLSEGERETAFKLIPLTSILPPYRGDLKGVVEVMHRIEKDAQFMFWPGAMDHRRAEMELRKVDPAKCTMTVRDYVQYLHILFYNYNLTADRSHRVDALMAAAGVHPSPAGLWNYGHQMGIGYRTHVGQTDLITTLLPSAGGSVLRDAVRFSGNDYSSKEVEKARWTTIARNFRSWKIEPHYYPGSLGQIWTPHPSEGLLELQLSDQSRGLAALTYDDWADSLALATMNKPKQKHQALMTSLQALAELEALRERCRIRTEEAIAKAKGPAPSITEARQMEAAAGHHSKSETKVLAELQDEGMSEHQALMKQLLETA